MHQYLLELISSYMDLHEVRIQRNYLLSQKITDDLRCLLVSTVTCCSPLFYRFRLQVDLGRQIYSCLQEILFEGGKSNLTVCSGIDIFEMCYRLLIRFPILIHHSCVHFLPSIVIGLMELNHSDHIHHDPGYVTPNQRASCHHYYRFNMALLSATTGQSIFIGLFL